MKTSQRRILMGAVLFLGLSFGLTACDTASNQGSASADSQSAATGDRIKTTQTANKRVAKDNAQIQTADKSRPTRVIKQGTKIKMHFGDTVITGVLNDSKTAKALIAKLPYTIHESRYDTDFCGTVDALPYNKSEEHYGWLNGDIDYATDAPYFTILFKGEENSEQYGSQVNIGVITTPLAKISNLEGSYDVRIELDE